MAGHYEPPNMQIARDQAADRVQDRFMTFLTRYQNAEGETVYVERIKELHEPERNTIIVDYTHIDQFDSTLAELMQIEFYRFYPALTRAVALVAQQNEIPNMHRKEVYLSIEGFPTKINIRQLTADRVGQLVRISGQVVRTHPVHPELARGVFMCDECGATIKFVEQQFKYTPPARCSNNNCPNSTRFTLDVHKSVFVDFQKIRIQETQAELPRGAMPRSVEVIVRGECVELAQPGDRCDFTGMLIVVPDVSQLSVPGAQADPRPPRGTQAQAVDGIQGLHGLGVRDLTYKTAFLACSIGSHSPKLGGIEYTHEAMAAGDIAAALSEQEKAEIYAMVHNKNIENDLADSLFPDIYGHQEVKRGALLQLFGGVPKTTNEGTHLRGDINICLVGDPSTAKSQVLKTIEQFCPRAVYTSGKASSAAGLTAAVVKDEESYEFVIEAGALMLADNGVCCIDEFDKMDVKDQVAIHEAMEQQTISITKAGVKATLNARTCILAAANPIGGRYDKSKSLRSNIQMSAPIMSRFDLFFVLVDDTNEATDYAIARRILDTHQRKGKAAERKYTHAQMQRYIMFARCFQPVLSSEAGEALVEEYKRLRMRDTSAGSAWRITVRQLESLVRLAEATARMHCTEKITAQHVTRAAHLLRQSIVRVETAEVSLEAPSQVSTGGNEENVPPAEDEPMEADDDSKKTRVTLAYDDYTRMATALATHLRQLEEATGENDDMGTRRSQLINWYMENMMPDIDSVEELTKRQELLERVIYRMAHIDNMLIELTQTEDANGETAKALLEDPILFVHPNLVLD